ncbi:flagellar basal body rod protein FlgC [Microvenator marinus]|jgi:flagellar basal-body rod protein FlgC|uniref:Flagellar basal-body rod protein FlgC n=1 Tax=Microvenator marinus TaxID=2600177 RepID=A0A5B8XSV2_9DELT|nr:flagellar basal body rod protein FlgC [Microvenator marinus]QED28644.1 flagellar basal body rod protein FlgC [Microvenator marinus]
MSFINGFDIAASALSAQRTRLTVTASNLANAETTRTAEGGAYQRQQVVFQTAAARFGDTLNDAAVSRVEVAGVQADQRDMRLVWDPEHPDARPDGYVEYPNVNVVEEMAEMVVASRSYEANVTSFETLKKMALRALNIG